MSALSSLLGSPPSNPPPPATPPAAPPAPRFRNPRPAAPPPTPIKPPAPRSTSGRAAAPPISLTPPPPAAPPPAPKPPAQAAPPSLPSNPPVPTAPISLTPPTSPHQASGAQAGFDPGPRRSLRPRFLRPHARSAPAARGQAPAAPLVWPPPKPFPSTPARPRNRPSRCRPRPPLWLLLEAAPSRTPSRFRTKFRQRRPRSRFGAWPSCTRPPSSSRETFS